MRLLGSTALSRRTTAPLSVTVSAEESWIIRIFALWGQYTGQRQVNPSFRCGTQGRSPRKWTQSRAICPIRSPFRTANSLSSFLKATYHLVNCIMLTFCDDYRHYDGVNSGSYPCARRRYNSLNSINLKHLNNIRRSILSAGNCPEFLEIPQNSAILAL